MREHASINKVGLCQHAPICNINDNFISRHNRNPYHSSETERERERKREREREGGREGGREREREGES